MRIGGGIDGREWRTPEEWLSVVKQLGYDAVYCPIDSSAPESLRRDFKKLPKLPVSLLILTHRKL